MLIERNVDGIKVRERPGSGQAVLCLHGIGSAARSFDPLVARLPADWRVVCWEAPGYAGSMPLDAAWPVASDYAERLHHLAGRLELDLPGLIGHSLGALMAAAFAVRHPESLSRLVLMSCALGHGAPVGGPLSEGAQARLTDLELMGAETFAVNRAPGLVHEPERHPVIVQQVYQNMRRVALGGYGQATRMLSSGRLLDDVAQLRVPTSVLVGEQDTITPVAANEAVYRAIPEAMRQGFSIVGNCGHALYQQRPDSCARFLAETFVGAAHV